MYTCVVYINLYLRVFSKIVINNIQVILCCNLFQVIYFNAKTYFFLWYKNNMLMLTTLEKTELLRCRIFRIRFAAIAKNIGQVVSPKISESCYFLQFLWVYFQGVKYNMENVSFFQLLLLLLSSLYLVATEKSIWERFACSYLSSQI